MPMMLCFTGKAIYKTLDEGIMCDLPVEKKPGKHIRVLGIERDIHEKDKLCMYIEYVDGHEIKCNQTTMTPESLFKVIKSLEEAKKTNGTIK